MRVARATSSTTRCAPASRPSPRQPRAAAVAEGLGLAGRIGVQTYDELAHLGACGIVTNLIEGRRQGLLRPKADGTPATVGIYAQGAGFTRGAAIVRWVA